MILTLKLERFFLGFPQVGWIKVNINEVARGSPGFTACGDIFRDNCGEYVSSFSTFLGIKHVLHVEVMYVIFVIEYAQLKVFKKFWLEYDCALLCQAFGSTHIIHWILKYRWCNCKQICVIMDFIVTYGFREGNSCPDILANLDAENRIEFAWYFILSY